MGVRVPPLELDGFRKGKPIGDGTRLETGRDHPSGGARALRVRLPPLPLFRSDAHRVPLAERSGTSLPNWTGGFNSRGALSGIG